MTVDYLNHAIIELTTECNIGCMHCYNWWKQDGEPPLNQNSYKKAFQLVDRLIKTTSVKHLTFTGGEPTISERFLELVLHAKLNHKKVTVITNGNGPTEIYRQLCKLQTNLIEFSIHSLHADIHDKITRKPGSWKKATQHMAEVLKQGIAAIPVIVITKQNFQDAVDTLRFFYDMGIHNAMVNRYNLGGEGLNHPNSLSANLDELHTVFREVNEYAATSGMRIVSGVCTPHCILNPDDYPYIRFGSCADDVYRRPLTFDIEGNLRLCNHSPIQVVNIYKQSMGNILSSTYIDEWSRLDIPFCITCTRLNKCRGGCRAASEQMGLTLKSVDPIVHELKTVPFTS